MPAKATSMTAKREIKQQLDASQKANRDRLCVPPKYPGKPEDYTYIVTEYCKLQKQNARQKKQLDGRISAAQNQAEIKKINVILDMYGETLTPGVSGKTLNVLGSVYTIMIMPENRRKYPDPSQRYAAAVKKEHAHEVPVHVVMRLVLRHLKAL